MNINQRVIHLIGKVASSKAAFSKATGISPVILSHIGSGRNKVSLTAVTQILEAYPKINAEYIIMGKGPVFKEDETEVLTAVLDQLKQAKALADSQHGQMIMQLQSLINHIQDT